MSNSVSADSVDSKPFGDGPGVQDNVDAKPFKAAGSGGTKGFTPEHVVTSEEFFSDKYKMTYPNRGKALIINNRVFDRRLNLGERTGTDVDAIALHQRFSEMGFEAEVADNLKVKDMVQVLHKASCDDDFNMKSDCFVCAILTHGEEGVVYGTDEKIEVKQLLEPFKGNNCKGLVGKPKIFFIQACQGVQFDAGVGVNTTDAKGDLPMDQDIQVHKIPSEADFLIAYSVVPGYFSWRNSANGSWFIQALSEVLAKSWKSLDLLTMMTRVNKKVAYDFESRTGKEFMNQKKQIPCITSMLTKEVLFTEK